MNPPKGDETIFAEALRLPPEKRADYLGQATAGNHALRQEIESLLASYGAGDFLEAPPASALRQTINVSIPVTEKPGDRIGRYKLLEQIGEGGCGVVYVAEQTEPVRRRVALKIIKLGLDTKSVVARFEAERQALAMMDHPNIAKVLDAGATETGRPYFVMELVRGLKITDYCDEKKLSTSARLDLFIHVCQAIQHAHQKGIIHRDIKPSNILVTVNDGVSVPKIIDFGIAKATSGQLLTDKTIYTAFQQFIGTPAYMSPEQAVLTSLDIDTRSDIYALGVLLYEMLTGRTPFDGQELLAIGLDEMRRTIREQEPPRPSTRLSTLPGQELSTTAQRRGLDAPKLVSELRGDLDWIVMKALEKDRARRYETANGLAADVQRHLNNEPVVACPPSRVYRFQKLVRRNKFIFAAGGSVVAALLIGLGVATWMFVRERAAVREQSRLRQQAQTEAAKSEQVARFLKDMLKAVRPEKALGRDTTILQEILDQTTERIARDLTNQPAVEAEIRHTLGITYRALGQYEKSERMLRQALALRKKLFGNEHPDVASLLNDLGFVLKEQNQLPEAQSLLGEALVMRRKLLGEENRDTAVTLENLGVVLNRRGNYTEAEPMLRGALAMNRRLLGSDDIGVAYSLNDLALVLWRQGKLKEAEPLFREVLTMSRRLLPAENPMVAQSLNNLGLFLMDLNQVTEAEPLIREALAMRKKLLGGEHPDVADSLRSLAHVLRKQKKLEEAERLHWEALAIRRKLLGDEHRDTANSSSDLAAVLADQGKLAEAEPLFREALTLRREFLGSEHPDVIQSLNKLARVLSRQGKHREELELRRAAAEKDDVEGLNNLAWLLAACSDSAIRNGKSAVGFAERAVAKTERQNAGYLDTLAAACAEAGDFARAVSVQTEAIALLREEKEKKDYESRLKLYQSNSPFRHRSDSR